jgi:hypothetical protein
MSTILLVVLVLLLVGALPTWPYSRGWGYYPSGGLGLVVLVLLVLALSGRLEAAPPGDVRPASSTRQDCGDSGRTVCDADTGSRKGLAFATVFSVRKNFRFP